MKSDGNRKKWFAFYTKSRQEKSVHNTLINNGYEVYLPLLRERKKWSDSKKWVEYPLFKSYLFIKIEPKTLYICIKNTRNS